MQNTNLSLIPDLDNELSDSRRKTVLKKCFDRVSQNLAVESIFVRSRDTLAKAVLKFRTQYPLIL